MLRIFALALVLLAAPTSAADLVKNPGQSGSHVENIDNGQTGYADFTASGVVWTNTAQCPHGVDVFFISNLAYAGDFDATAKLWSCPEGTKTASATLCRQNPYLDATSAGQDTLNGDASKTVGRAALFGVKGLPNLVVAVTSPTPGTGTAYIINGAHSTSDTTIAIDTGSGTVLAGDTVRFEDDATVYLVTVGVAAPGTITISPGLTQDQTDNKTVTILSQTSRVTVLCP